MTKEELERMKTLSHFLDRRQERAHAFVNSDSEVINVSNMINDNLTQILRLQEANKILLEAEQNYKNEAFNEFQKNNPCDNESNELMQLQDQWNVESMMQKKKDEWRRIQQAMKYDHMGHFPAQQPIKFPGLGGVYTEEEMEEYMKPYTTLPLEVEKKKKKGWGGFFS